MASKDFFAWSHIRCPVSSRSHILRDPSWVTLNHASIHLWYDAILCHISSQWKMNIEIWFYLKILIICWNVQLFINTAKHYLCFEVNTICLPTFHISSGRHWVCQPSSNPPAHTHKCKLTHTHTYKLVIFKSGFNFSHIHA